MTSFRDIRFGYASAEMESQNAPDLLLDGFWDLDGIIEEVVHGPRFLYLGYKGSGKSAIGEHLRLAAESNSTLFVTTTFLSDFPYTDFKKIVSGDAEPESKYPTAWSWLLLLAMVNSLAEDHGSLATDTDFGLAVRSLKNMGLIPSKDLREIVLLSSKKSFKAKIPTILEGQVEFSYGERDLELFKLVQFLKKVVTSFRSESRHLLIIDGLDDILTAREVQYQSLAALILEASRLNADFARAGSKVKVVILCRTDLFERLPGPNKNKIRQDSAMQLDWYDNPRKPEESKLIELMNLRAHLVDSAMPDVIDKFFPSHIDGGSSTLTTLLELTRHTPRDFLQLMVHIQKYAGQQSVSREQAMSGIRDYSINYFLPELKDELVGYMSAETVEAIFSLIGSLRKRDFSYKELIQKNKEFSTVKESDIRSGIATLFECSAIGNVQHRPTGTTHYTFKYRNRHSTLNHDDRLLLHKGVWKAMNLI